MRSSLIPLALLLLAAPAWAQDLPAQFSVQGLLTDAEGAPAEGDIEIVFDLVDDEDTVLWTETQTVTVEGGLFTATLGAGDDFPLTTDFFRDNLTLGLQVAVDGDDPMEPIAIVPAPFAAYSDYAGQAATLEGLSAADLTISASDGLVLNGDNELSLDIEACAEGSSIREIGADGSVECQDTPDAIGSDEITDGSVALADLADNSVDSSALVNGSVALADLANPALSAYGEAPHDTLTLGSSPVPPLFASRIGSSSGSVGELESFTISNVPGPGQLTVRVFGNYYASCDATCPIGNQARVGICDTSAGTADCGNTWVLAGAINAGMFDETGGQRRFFQLERTVTVGAAGSRTFYVNGKAIENNGELFIAAWVTASFTPGTALTVTTPPEP